MSFWRKEPPLLATDGSVACGGMWESQRKAWDSKHFIKAFIGGYGAGKSSIISKRCIASAIYNAPTPVMVVSPTYRLAQRTIVRAIKSLLDGRKIKYTFSKADFEFTIHYGGRVGTIWIGSGEHPESLKGPNLASSFLDEIFLMDKEVFDQILARVRDPAARLREIWFSGTPENLNWGYDVCAGDQKSSYDIDVYNVGTRENKALPDEFINTLYDAYDERTARAYIEGEFVNLNTGAIFHSFDQDRHVKVVPEPVLPNGMSVPLFVGNDFNVNPMAGVIFWVYKGHIHIVDEIILSGGSDTVEFVHECWNRSKHRITRFYPDPSGIQRKTSATGGVTDMMLIQREGQYLRGKPFEIKARPRTPPKRDRYNAMNEMFRHDNYTIDPSCKALIKALNLSTYEKTKGQEELSHIIDGASYMAELEFGLQAKVTQGRRWYGK